MKVGTPGFQGERLRQARIAIGLSQASLALMLGGKTAQMVSVFESGENTPSPETFNRIVSVTRQPAHFYLTRVPEDLTSDAAHFRSLRSLDELARARAEVHLLWLAEYVRYVKTHVELPPLDLPDFSDIPRDPLQITREHIRQAAQRLRAHWHLGSAPLPDLINLLEASGFIVAVQPFDSPKWDAVSFWDEQGSTPIILLNSDKPSHFRMRFNLAHELFHLLFHRYCDSSLKRSKDIYRFLEEQAHYFAGELGLPYGTFEKDLYDTSLDAMRVVKMKWRFSIGSMIHRLNDLGLTNDREDTNLWKNYSRRKWRASEPLDKEIEPEHPTVLNRAVSAMVEHSAQSVEEIRINGIFSESTQDMFINMGEDFWRPPTPQLKVHKMFG